MRRDRQQCAKDFRSDYATHADFCDALAQDTKSLYLLAFLLTTNHGDAEHCFAATVEKVFKPANCVHGLGINVDQAHTHNPSNYDRLQSQSIQAKGG